MAGRATHFAIQCCKSFNGKPQASASRDRAMRQASACGLPLNDRAKCVVRPTSTLAESCPWVVWAVLIYTRRVTILLNGIGLEPEEDER